jgi:hypothetical protein
MVPCFARNSTLNIDVTCYSETSVDIQRTTWTLYLKLALVSSSVHSLSPNTEITRSSVTLENLDQTVRRRILLNSLLHMSMASVV